MPVAIDINHLMHQQDAEGEFFRHIAEQGHYAGRTRPSSTRQGLYVTGVDGDLVGSINSTRADDVVKLLRRGAARWNESSADKPFRRSNKSDSRYVVSFPEGGMILRETMRDLPSASNSRRKFDRHNFDHVWLTAEEKKNFMPSRLSVGHSWSISESTVKSLAAYHTIDQVRGEATPFSMEQVKEAVLSAEVVAVKGHRALVKLTGKIRNVKTPTGQRNPFNGYKVEQNISNNLKLRGWLIYDSAKKDFGSFRLLAAGQRSGSDVYNFRWDDRGPARIGFAFEMLEDIPSNRVRPKYLNQ